MGHYLKLPSGDAWAFDPLQQRHDGQREVLDRGACSGVKKRTCSDALKPRPLAPFFEHKLGAIGGHSVTAFCPARSPSKLLILA